MSASHNVSLAGAVESEAITSCLVSPLETLSGLETLITFAVKLTLLYVVKSGRSFRTIEQVVWKGDEISLGTSLASLLHSV